MKYNINTQYWNAEKKIWEDAKTTPYLQKKA